MNIDVQLLTNTAKMPTKSHEQAAGYDLYSDEEVTIPAQQRKIIKTGIATLMPDNYVALIQDRSGLAAKHGLTVLAGVIDSDYTGEYLVVLLNTTTQDYTVHQHDRIAQILFIELAQAQLREVKELPLTQRGQGRFASSGY